MFELCMGEQEKYNMVERKSKVIEECVTHDTVTAAGYAEQCVVELTYPNVHYIGPLDCGRHH